MKTKMVQTSTNRRNVNYLVFNSEIYEREKIVLT